MPYLPVNPLHDTEFPASWGKDVELAIAQIEERYRRFHTPIDYYMQSVTVAPPTDAEDADELHGSSPGERFDPIYGETVHDGDGDGEWDQPHSPGDSIRADNKNADVFQSAVVVHARVRREARDSELHKYGFDHFRDLLIHIPLSVLDREGITVRDGDKFTWDGDPYRVVEHDRVGYWKNTNLRMFMAINAEHMRQGS